MATAQDMPVLAERIDIHKSCKSLETLLGVLNDYCEAANAIALLQRKLAKALRDTAGVKVTGETASNAMNTAAAMFEMLAEIDSKFAKITDKEYNALSTEVKKWFKKLSKEEKAHDERMSNANNRIKQAGQVYEKKSKKNPREAVDEHARYINLISSLGPEISQEKYNHANLITQRHTATTFSTAACLARIADAEWLRTCESVRRFSPAIGPLLEWRTYCEGGWQGPLPLGLPDLEAPKDTSDQPVTMNSTAPASKETLRTADFETQRTVSFQRFDSRESVPDQGRASMNSNEQELYKLPPNSSSPFERRPQLQSLNTTTTSSGSYNDLAPPQMPAAAAPAKNSMDSVRTLSAFPLPPDHFPLPPPRSAQQGSLSQSSQSSSQPRMTESPLPESESSPETSRLVPAHAERPTLAFTGGDEGSKAQLKAPPNTEPSISSKNTSPIISSVTPATFIPEPRPGSRSPETSLRDYSDGEFGMRYGQTPKAKTIDVANFNVDRSDPAGTTQSLVAAMRNRYASGSGAISPTKEREAPRLNKSVNELAARYEPNEEPSSPRMRSPSNSSIRPLPQQPQPSQRTSVSPNEVQSRAQPQRAGSYDPRGDPAVSTASKSDMAQDQLAAAQRQMQLADLAQIERKEQELRQRERELEYRTRELESERARLTNVPEADESGYNAQAAIGNAHPQPQRRVRERKTSFKLFGNQPQAEEERQFPTTSTSPGRPYGGMHHSYSASNLAAPPVPGNIPRADSYDRQSQASYNTRLSNASQQSVNANGHAPFCGCEACSASKYKESASPTALFPPSSPTHLRPIPEKKTSWMKRLSMPVGSALGLDSKKGVVNVPGGGMTLDGKKISSTALYDRSQIDGRRSYDSSAMGNRSMTNLASSVGGRRL